VTKSLSLKAGWKSEIMPFLPITRSGTSNVPALAVDIWGQTKPRIVANLLSP
jgi:hypothetical protein